VRNPTVSAAGIAANCKCQGHWDNTPPGAKSGLGSGGAMVVRQITDAIGLRMGCRIVCWRKPSDELARGEQSVIIKQGCRTELVMPAEEGLEIRVRLGDKVQTGRTIVAQY